MLKTRLTSSIYSYWLEHFFNQIQLCKKISHYLDIKPTEKVLDIGGGRGSLANLLRLNTGAQLVVAEANDFEITRGRRKFVSVDFIHSEAEQLPFPEEEFDHVLMVRMLHFVRQPEKAIREAARVLKPGGKLFIADHDFSNPIDYYVWRPLKTLAVSKTVAFSPEEIDIILSKYGFTPQRHTTSGLLISAVKVTH